jgi:hypothetical protein
MLQWHEWKPPCSEGCEECQTHYLQLDEDEVVGQAEMVSFAWNLPHVEFDIERRVGVVLTVCSL